MILVKPGARFNDARDLLKSCEFTIKDVVESCGDIDRLNKHYFEHAGRYYYDALIWYMMEGPIFAIRLALHPAACFGHPGNPRTLEAKCLTDLRMAIREYRQRNGADGPRNFFHCSDSLEAKEREDQLWFGST